MFKMLNKLFIVIISMLVVCITNIAYAYSLNDVKQDYHRFKIKEESYTADSGQVMHSRYGKIMTLKTDAADIVELNFYLGELNEKKYVTVIALFYGDSWMLMNRLTIGDGTNAYDLYPNEKPTRMLEGRHTSERMKFYLLGNDYATFNKWKNAKIIRVKGDSLYSEYEIDPAEYTAVMNVIQKYLFE